MVARIRVDLEDLKGIKYSSKNHTTTVRYNDNQIFEVDNTSGRIGYFNIKNIRSSDSEARDVFMNILKKELGIPAETKLV